MAKNDEMDVFEKYETCKYSDDLWCYDKLSEWIDDAFPDVIIEDDRNISLKKINKIFDGEIMALEHYIARARRGLPMKCNIEPREELEIKSRILHIISLKGKINSIKEADKQGRYLRKNWKKFQNTDLPINHNLNKNWRDLI